MDVVISDPRPHGAVSAVPEKYRATLHRLLEASTAYAPTTPIADRPGAFRTGAAKTLSAR